ncbi:MAG: heme biosynthesis protein HemY [Paracoccaceae bacterium]
MLWTLLKIVIFLGIVVAGTWGIGALMEVDGGVRLSVAGTELTLGPLESIIALILLMVASWLLFKIVGLVVAFVRFALGDTTAINRFFDRRRERRGYDALAEGMMALASGESKLAMTQAAKAERLLERPELTTLLTAQAAEQAGDLSKATQAYKTLLKDDKTRFVGVRGLMKQQLDAGDTEKALKLAEKAFALKPKHVETQDTLLQLQANAHDWAAARQTLGAKLKHGGLPRDVHKRRDAVLALGHAKDIDDPEKAIEAQEAAIEANRLSPDLIPAAIMAADGYIADKKPKNATRVIKKAWAVQPHPDLAGAFARIKPEESPKVRLKRFAVLTGQHQDHPETRMLKAELLIAAEDFQGARAALGDLAESAPTTRALAIMAAVEKGSGSDDAVVKGWLARALTAPRDAQWVCDNCQKANVAWNPVCEHCGAFDTLSWRQTDNPTATLPSGAEMLPLIVGQIEGPSADAEDAEIVEDDAGRTLDDLDGDGVDPNAAEIVRNAASEASLETANADAPPIEEPRAKDVN